MSWTFEVSHAIADTEIQRHRLHNGLGVILMRDVTSPIVSYQSWYRVGSRHELPGQTGMAHLFEHLMFNRTVKNGRGEFDRIIEHTGGDNNAATWVDWTYYRDTIPPADLSTIVDLEADRMNNLVLESPELESEREVVANERLQRVDDDVDGFADEELARLAYRVHPYRWPTIGWMEDIRSMNLDQVRSFYRTYYAPNNATVVVVGGFESQQVLDTIEAQYGSMSAAEIPAEECPAEPPQTTERRTQFTKPTPAARYMAGYPSVGLGHPDWPALSFLSALLSVGASSRLYRRLVIESEIANHVHVDLPPFRDPGLLRVSAHLRRDNSPERAEEVIDAAIAELTETLISDDELEKVRNVAETDFWSELESCDGRAEALGHFETTLGDFRELFRVADALGSVEAADVQRVAAHYLRADRRNVVTVLPENNS